MPAWFRKGPSPYQTPLAMIGAKSGDSVVVVSADDPALAAELACVTGLNGQTTVVDDDSSARERVEAAAAAAGTLIEFAAASPAHLPFDDGSRDIVVVSGLAAIDARSRDAVVEDVARVLRYGGRVVIIDGRRRTGLLGSLPSARPRLIGADVLSALDRAGLKARRLLAEAGGVAFYEARKAPPLAAPSGS